MEWFKGGEVRGEECNELGLGVGEKVGGNDEVGVYRDGDREDVENDIVINWIEVERGKKFKNNKEGLGNVRDLNDEVWIEDGLRVGEKERGGLGYREREKGIGEGNRK